MTERQEGVCLSVDTFSAGKSKEIRALQAEDQARSGRRIQAATLSRDGPALSGFALTITSTAP